MCYRPGCFAELGFDFRKSDLRAKFEERQVQASILHIVATDVLLVRDFQYG